MTDAAAARPHITVCICTFKRGAMLDHLLHELEQQRTDHLFTHGVVVADNDVAESAAPIVRSFASTSSLPVTYCVEAEPNIARARNLALAHAHGDFVAFIDDDEFPVRDWLYRLWQTRTASNADAVLGPVVPHFDHEPPQWLKKGRFFDRPRYPTGRRLAWTEARSGNVLFARGVLADLDPPFRPQFATAGEDIDFFRRIAQQGRVFVWCDEAVAFEHVPSSRCTRRHLFRRAALRGSNFPKHPTRRLRNALKSLIAVPCYTLALPVLGLAGQHLLIAYLVKILEHGSRLLAYAGLPLVTQRES
jgi:glycosyltransferase involved in cell wall biosynthesis